jgi:hypothetical protein
MAPVYVVNACVRLAGLARPVNVELLTTLAFPLEVVTFALTRGNVCAVFASAEKMRTRVVILVVTARNAQ